MATKPDGGRRWLSCEYGEFLRPLAGHRGKPEHLSMLPRAICLPEIGVGTWNYTGGVEPLWAEGSTTSSVSCDHSAAAYAR